MLLKTYVTSEQRAALANIKPIQLIIRTKKDTSLKNILTKTIRLGKISKNTTRYLKSQR
jgi:hypothetical protein